MWSVSVWVWTDIGSRLFALQVWALQQVPPVQPINPDASFSFSNVTNIGQVLIFLTMVVTTIVTLYTQARARKWENEDRQRIAKDLAERLEREARGREAVATKLSNQIEENTDISKNAFREANTVNQKIAKITEAFDSVQGRQFDKTTQLVSEVKDITEDTNKQVTAITAASADLPNKVAQNETLIDIEQTGLDTNVRVRELKKDNVKDKVSDKASDKKQGK